MSGAPAPCPDVVQYFVDEAGDGVLFGPKGRDRLGDPGASRYFMLGMVQCEAVESVAAALAELRSSLIANPLYASIPSLSAAAAKTARFFHAKDDHAEIRAKVFELLLTMDFRFFAVVKDMRNVRSYVQGRNQMHSAYRYNPNELYDLTVRMLFKHRLHKSETYRITISPRGKSDRTAALRMQLETARSRFLRTIGATPNPVIIDIAIVRPEDNVGLQMVDYCLWALQRAYERHEVRFLHAIWPKVSLIHDVDEGSKPYGLYRTRKDPPPSEEEMKRR